MAERALTLARPEVEKGITIGSAYAWGAALGGVERASPKAAAVMEFVGAIGGLIGAMITPAGLNDFCEGVACASGALLGLGLAAPSAAKRVIQGRGEIGAKSKIERLMLKQGGVARDIIAEAAGARAMVGAGLE